jgi:hypothetical protein
MPVRCLSTGNMKSLIDVVKAELSGSKAKSFVAELTHFHRIQGSPLMHAAAEHVMDELREIGVDAARIERFPADGREKYWTYTAVMGWDVRGAELRLIKPHQKLLARFSEVPQSLHTYSRGTPKGGVTAELIDVGKGVSEDDYAGKDVKGKLVLATGSARSVHNEAVIKRGAAGVLTDSLAYEFPGVRESMDIPDAHSYQGIWPDARVAEKVRFGFSLSKRQGNELRSLLETGKPVELHAEVDADLSPGEYSIVNASIKGSERPDEEVFIVAHLCHPMPGANDNASGSGLLVEIARAIVALIGAGKIGRPKRTLRFLWVPETTGTAAFLSRHPELWGRLVAGINLDMVGEDQAQCGSTLCLTCTPDSVPSFLNDLVYAMVEGANAAYDKLLKLGMVSGFRYARTPFSDGSDHAEFNESTVGAPCVALTQWPDKFYHTSMDTLDKVSEDSLARVGLAVSASVIVMADADPGIIHRLSSLTASEGMKRISDAVGDAAKNHLDPKGGKPAAARENVSMHDVRLRHIIDREEQAVRSVSRLDKDVGTDSFVEAQALAVRAHGERERTRLSTIMGQGDGKVVPEASTGSMSVVPRRLFKGTLDPDLMKERLGEESHAWYREMDKKDATFSGKMYEIVNLMDGRRSLREIAEFVSAEYGPTEHKVVLRVADDLKRIRLVAY